MKIEDAQIQLIDLPGIILGAAAGKGRGREIIAAARNADLILILISFQFDGTIDFDHLYQIRKELYDAGIRLNEQPPRIQIKPRTRGGIGFTYNGKQIMDQEEVKALMNELGYSNAAVYFFEPNVTPDQLIDHVMANRKYIKEFVVINKSDLEKHEFLDEKITKIIGHDNWIKISALNNEHIDDLKHEIFQQLNLIRVYLKPPGKEVDKDEPIILKEGDTIEHLCSKLHKTFVQYYRYSLIWGPSAKHPGQKFNSMDHVLADGDIVSIYLKR